MQILVEKIMALRPDLLLVRTPDDSRVMTFRQDPPPSPLRMKLAISRCPQSSTITITNEACHPSLFPLGAKAESHRMFPCAL
jgi:hypothetical protein